MSTVYFATSTFYPQLADSVRQSLAEELFRAVNKLPGVTAVVVDGGSSPEFLDCLRGLGVLVYQQVGKTMNDARLEAFYHVRDLSVGDENAVVVWCEPEKVDFVRSIPLVIDPVVQGRADMVIPVRKSLQSYPHFQALTEKAADDFVTLLVGDSWDEFFGPVAFKLQLLQYFLDFNVADYGVTPDNSGWALTHGPRLVAQARGAKIVTVEVDYAHPKSQTEEEEESLAFCLKRVEQLGNLLSVIWMVAQRLGLTDQVPNPKVVSRFVQLV